MASRRAGGRRGGADAPQRYQGTYSGYGQTRGDSVGYNPMNPQGYMATQGKKKYTPKADMVSINHILRKAPDG